MSWPLRFLLLALLWPASAAAQQSSGPVAQAIAQGDLYLSKRKYELALDAYKKADKLSHHTSAAAYLRIATVERKAGDFPAALDDTKRALKVAGDNRSVAIDAHLLRGTTLTQMAGKPTDKKLGEAEQEFRDALTLDPAKPVSRYNLGMVLLKQERDAEGLAELNQFIAMPGADPRTVAEARRVIASPIRAREPFAPDFSFVTRENQTVSNGSLRGKVVLLDFWGTWCPPCRESVPTLRSLNKKYAGKPFQLVGISSDDDEDVWKTFIDSQQMTWAEYIDLSGEVLEAFKIESYPTYIVVDKDGVICFRQSGFNESITQVELEDAINKALKRASDPALAAAAFAAASAGGASAGNTSAKQPGSDNPAPAASTPLTGIEVAVISGNTYKNEELGMTYEFPQGWVAAKPESLHALNERTEAAAKASVLQQHPELAEHLQFSMPKAIFYASRRGQGDAQHLSVPCIRIQAIPSRLDTLHLEAFRSMVQNMAIASGMKVVAPVTEFAVKNHQLLRADLEPKGGNRGISMAYVETLAGGYMLTIELYASSPQELQQLAASLESMVITEDEEP